MKYFIFLLLPVFLLAGSLSSLHVLENYLDDTKVDILLNKDTFSIFYSYKYKQPVYTVSILTPQNVKIKTDRTKLCKFKADSFVPKEYRSTLDDYKDSGYDRGHLASYASSDFTILGAKESCLLSNMSPQTAHFNRVKWRKIEHSTRELAKTQKIKVVTIVFFDNNPFNDKFLKTGNHLKIPDGFAKIIMDSNGTIIKYWFVEHK